MADIRIDIEVTGEDKAKSGLRSLKQEFKKIQAPAKKLNDRFKKLQRTTVDLRGALKTLKDMNRKLKVALNRARAEVRKLKSGMDKLGGGAKKASMATKDASFSMSHMIARSISLVAVLGLVFKAVELVGAGFRKAFDSVEKYKKQVAGLTALTLTFMKTNPGEGLADQYNRAKDFAKGLFAVIEDVAAETLLTGQQAALMARTFLENGVAINFQNQQQIQGLKSIANALAIVTEGQAKERQIRSEINSLLKGRIRATESLGTLLKAINPNILDQLKIWKQQGTVIENVSALLKGFDATTGDIAVTWEAISTTISTTADRVLRGSFQPVYNDILNITLKINKWLEVNKDIVQIKLLNAYRETKKVLTEIFAVVILIKNTSLLIVDAWDKLNSLPVIPKLIALLSPFKGLSRAISFLNKQIPELRDKLTDLGISDEMKKIPTELRRALNPEQIKTLIDEGFTSGLLPAGQAMDIMAKRIVTSRERLDELAGAARKAGVEFSTIDLTRIIKDIPTLEKVSAITFEKMAKGIQEILTVKGVKFALHKDFAKLLIPEFNKITEEAEKALEKLFARVRAKMEKFALQASGLGLRGDEKEEFKITKKFDRMILARKAFFEKERAVLKEKNPELLRELQNQLSSEFELIEDEKDRQLEIYRNFTTKIKALQQGGAVLGVDIKTIGLQQELNKLTGDYAKSLNDTSELIKLESEFRQNSLDIAIMEAEKKKELGTLTLDQANLLIDALNRQKEAEGALAEIRAGNAEKMKTETGAFMLGLEEQINSFGNFNEQVKDLGIEVANSLNNNFQTFFFDAMKGELKTAEDYWRSFSQSIMQMLSQILSKWLMMKALGAIGGIPTAHSGGVVMHDGGKVGDTSKLKRFHQGGLNSDERVAVLQTGERVLSRRQNRDFEDGGGRSSSQPMIVNMNVSATDADSFNSRILQSKEAVANAMMSASSDNHRVRRG